MANVDFSHVTPNLVKRSHDKTISDLRQVQELSTDTLTKAYEWEEGAVRSEANKKYLEKAKARVNEISDEIIRQCRELSDEEFLSEERIKERERLSEEMLKLIHSIMGV